MTRERLEDLLDAFYQRGWVRLSHDDWPGASVDPFTLEEETIEWALGRERDSRVLELQFWATGRMGERTRDLRNLVWCRVEGTQLELHFSKRGHKDWLESVERFVEAVQKHVETE